MTEKDRGGRHGEAATVNPTEKQPTECIRPQNGEHGILGIVPKIQEESPLVSMINGIDKEGIIAKSTDETLDVQNLNIEVNVR